MKILLFFIPLSLSAKTPPQLTPEKMGKMTSPFNACKDVTIVAEDMHKKFKANWVQHEKDCGIPVQIAEQFGVTTLSSMNEAVKYVSFSQRVAEKVVENLQKNQVYVKCSADCFAGATTCAPGPHEKKIILCSDRKKEIQESMKVFSRKIRMELALSHEAPAILTDVNITNVLTVEKEKLINTNLRSFDSTIPNPLGNTALSPREMREALRRSARDRKMLEQEAEAKKITNPNWLPMKMMSKYEEHQKKYLSLVYEEAPIFSVIAKPERHVPGDDPEWSNQQMVEAFQKLSQNISRTEDKVKRSIQNSTLEFSRMGAAGEWMSSFSPNSKEDIDLLYYISMKNQVEEVLKEDPSQCAVATSLVQRFESKEIQNTGLLMGTSIVGGIGLKIALRTANVGKALTLAHTAALSGAALSGTLLADTMKDLAYIEEEIATRSGLSAQESIAIRTNEEFQKKKDEKLISLALLPVDALGVWGVGRVTYNSLFKTIARELPEAEPLIKEAATSAVARDKVVDQWLALRMNRRFKDGLLTTAEVSSLLGPKGQEIFQNLTLLFEKKNPDFFKTPGNIDFLLKATALIVKKEKGDLADLTTKGEALLLSMSNEATAGAWGPKGQEGFLKVFGEAMNELRLTLNKDPATYAKASYDPESQYKIFLNALKRSGAKDEDLPSLVMCALPHRRGR